MCVFPNLPNLSSDLHEVVLKSRIHHIYCRYIFITLDNNYTTTDIYLFSFYNRYTVLFQTADTFYDLCNFTFYMLIVWIMVITFFPDIIIPGYRWKKYKSVFKLKIWMLRLTYSVKSEISYSVYTGILEWFWKPIYCSCCCQ